MLIKEKETNLNLGQSLLEVVFSIVISALVISGIVSLASVAVRNSSFARNKTLATRHVQETSEWIRQRRDEEAWSVFSSRNGEFCLNDLPLTGWPAIGNCGTETINDEIFKREIVLTPTGNVVEVVITVYWSDAKGNHDVNSRVRLTNWQEP